MNDRDSILAVLGKNLNSVNTSLSYPNTQIYQGQGGYLPGPRQSVNIEDRRNESPATNFLKTMLDALLSLD